MNKLIRSLKKVYCKSYEIPDLVAFFAPTYPMRNLRPQVENNF
jgi:hypothetical protein